MFKSSLVVNSRFRSPAEAEKQGQLLFNDGELLFNDLDAALKSYEQHKLLRMQEEARIPHQADLVFFVNREHRAIAIARNATHNAIWKYKDALTCFKINSAGFKLISAKLSSLASIERYLSSLNCSVISTMSSASFTRWFNEKREEMITVIDKILETKLTSQIKTSYEEQKQKLLNIDTQKIIDNAQEAKSLARMRVLTLELEQILERIEMANNPIKSPQPLKRNATHFSLTAIMDADEQADAEVYELTRTPSPRSPTLSP